MKVVAEEYGGAFHDTGSMSSWWNDYRPAVMRSSGLPCTIEPGNGAPDLRTLKLFFGHWSTEGVSAVDYFQNLGEITWAAELKAWFEAHQPLVHLFVKRIGCGGLLKPAPGQTILTSPRWQHEVRGNGMELERVAPDCQDVLLWAEGGGVALGLRPLGQGYVVHLAAGFQDNYSELLQWRGIVDDNPKAQDCRVTPYVSNNGLYHVYTLWADRLQAPRDVTLVFPGTDAPEALRDVLTGATLPGVPADGSRQFGKIAVEPLDTRAYLAPRRQITTAPRDWLELQRSWWKGTRPPAPAGKGKDVVLYVEGPRADIACIYINGRRLNRSAGMMRGHHFRINLMPWIQWDEPNELEIEAGYRGPHDVMNITQIELRYY